jgi:L-iditol 2-dehydrogenase
MTPTRTMRAVRLHGVRDLRVETLPQPVPGPGELLVRVEACGVCPTDIRKYVHGLKGGDYPLNPGHEWVGRVEAAGRGVSDWDPGRRVYGDIYAGYAEYALLATEPSDWSNGAFELPEELPAERAVFVEPLADCLHAVGDQARIQPGDSVVVVGAGQMGLQLVLAAATQGAEVLAVDRLPERRALARSFGARDAVSEDDWPEAGAGAEAVVVSVGDPDAVGTALEAVAPGGRVVLFAGFGDRGEAVLDLNRIHYGELAVVGSEWIGAPPNQRRERYEQALDLLVSGAAPLERLVDARCGLDGLEAAFEAQGAHRSLKTVVFPWD